MTSQVILKKSSVAARVPVAGDLAFGELALNYADGLLYYKKSDGTTIGSIGGSGISVATYNRTAITATAGQTTFTATYVVPYIAVYYNGVLLKETDYTATNGTSVILAVAADLNDIIEVVAYATTSVGTGGGGGGTTTAAWTQITAATTAVTGQQFLVASTVGTLTLPASPVAGNSVTIMDGGDWSTTNLTIARNGSTIEGIASDLICDVPGTILTIVYDGTTWQVSANTGAQGAQGPAGNSAGTSFSNQYILFGTSTNATEIEIFVNGVSGTRMPIALNKTIHFAIESVARRTDVIGDHAAFSKKSVAANNNNVSADIGAIYEIVVARTDATWKMDIRTNAATNTKSLYVTGAAGKTINWRAVVTTLEV